MSHPGSLHGPVHTFLLPPLNKVQIPGQIEHAVRIPKPGAFFYDLVGF
jgi:hypothetical protein